MPETFPELDEPLSSFIRAQNIFFVATAPDNLREGHISLSPKGSGTLEVLDGKTIAYGDFPGTENEIATNLNQNGKMTMVFISFDKTPKILRLYGRGEAITLHTPRGRELAERMKGKVTSEIRQWIVPAHRYRQDRLRQLHPVLSVSRGTGADQGINLLQEQGVKWPGLLSLTPYG